MSGLSQKKFWFHRFWVWLYAHTLVTEKALLYARKMKSFEKTQWKNWIFGRGFEMNRQAAWTRKIGWGFNRTIPSPRCRIACWRQYIYNFIVFWQNLRKRSTNQKTTWSSSRNSERGWNVPNVWQVRRQDVLTSCLRTILYEWSHSTDPVKYFSFRY